MHVCMMLIQEKCLAFYFIRVEWFIEPEVVDFVIKSLESVDQKVLAYFVVGWVEDLKFVVSTIVVLLEI